MFTDKEARLAVEEIRDTILAQELQRRQKPEYQDRELPNPAYPAEELQAIKIPQALLRAVCMNMKASAGFNANEFAFTGEERGEMCDLVLVKTNFLETIIRDAAETISFTSQDKDMSIKIGQLLPVVMSRLASSFRRQALDHSQKEDRAKRFYDDHIMGERGDSAMIGSFAYTYFDYLKPYKNRANLYDTAAHAALLDLFQQELEGKTLLSYCYDASCKRAQEQRLKSDDAHPDDKKEFLLTNVLLHIYNSTGLQHTVQITNLILSCNLANAETNLNDITSIEGLNQLVFFFMRLLDDMNNIIKEQHQHLEARQEREEHNITPEYIRNFVRKIKGQAEAKAKVIEELESLEGALGEGESIDSEALTRLYSEAEDIYAATLPPLPTIPRSSVKGLMQLTEHYLGVLAEKKPGKHDYYGAGNPAVKKKQTEFVNAARERVDTLKDKLDPTGIILGDIPPNKKKVIVDAICEEIELAKTTGNDGFLFLTSMLEALDSEVRFDIEQLKIAGPTARAEMVTKTLDAITAKNTDKVLRFVSALDFTLLQRALFWEAHSDNYSDGMKEQILQVYADMASILSTPGAGIYSRETHIAINAKLIQLYNQVLIAGLQEERYHLADTQAKGKPPLAFLQAKVAYLNSANDILIGPDELTEKGAILPMVNKVRPLHSRYVSNHFAPIIKCIEADIQNLQPETSQRSSWFGNRDVALARQLKMVLDAAKKKYNSTIVTKQSINQFLDFEAASSASEKKPNKTSLRKLITDNRARLPNCEWLLELSPPIAYTAVTTKKAGSLSLSSKK